MLTKVFQSAPFKYAANEFGTFNVWGMVTQPIPTVNGPDTLYLFVRTLAHVIGTFQGELYSWDATKGVYLSNKIVNIPVFANTSITISRGGILYFVGVSVFSDTSLIPFSITDFTDDTPAAIPSTRFINGFGSGPFQLDEEVDVLLTTDGVAKISLYQLSTGKFLSNILLPDVIIAMGLQNTNCVYCLCANRMLVLVDYVQGRVIGAVKGPPSLVTGGNYVTGIGFSISLFWYARYQRILMAEVVPDIMAIDPADGVLKSTAQTVIRGFAPNPVATRLTTPIPLKEPLTNRTIPILTCLVDDSNFGQAGALINAVISGDSSTTIANGIYTDTHGRANIPARCGAAPATPAINCSTSV